MERTFTLPFPGSVAEAVAFLRDVNRSLERVAFIKNLRVDGADVLADLRIDAPVIGEQLLDFQSVLEALPDGAKLRSLERSGNAWAEVAGEGTAQPAGDAASIEYRLRIVAHLNLPAAERWGGRAFEKMVFATAQRAIERMTLEFPDGVAAAMPRG